MSRTLRLASVTILCAAALPACTGAAPVLVGSVDMATAPDLTIVRPPLGMPVDVPKNTWSWIDFPDSACDDGTPTGIGVNPGTSNNLLVFINGGGACWAYDLCFVLNASVHGPYGKPQFDAEFGGATAKGSILSRDAGNPFADYTYVFVPYCTGDVHAGAKVTTYTNGTDSRVMHHVGHLNFLAFMKRIAATWPTPDKAVLSGASAGGFGAAMNYNVFRQYFAASKASYLIDDSGPVFKGDELPQGYRDAWYASWGLDQTLGPICPDCQMDLSAFMTGLGKNYPTDRMALLSSLQDQTISGYFVQSPGTFQANLLDTATTVLDPIPNFHYFFVPGKTHTMVGNPARFTSNGVGLWTWLTQMINDDPAWTSHKPPGT